VNFPSLVAVTDAIVADEDESSFTSIFSPGAYPPPETPTVLPGVTEAGGLRFHSMDLATDDTGEDSVPPSSTAVAVTTTVDPPWKCVGARVEASLPGTVAPSTDHR
jgi:hypothetical protein